MATNKKKSLNKAFIYVGKVLVEQPDKKKVLQDKYIVMSEDLAKFIGAEYSIKAPEAKKITIQKGLLKGRTRLVEHSVRITGTTYKLGYVDGTKISTTTGKRVANIRWIPIHISKDITLRQFLKIIREKFKKKPVYFQTPAGVTTRFVYK